MAEKQKRKIAFNGVNPLTGLPLQASCSPRWLASNILRASRDEPAEREINWAHEDRERDPSRRTAEGVDPLDLASCGWGVVFPEDAKQREDLRKALRPLLDHRKEQAASKNEKYYREFIYHEGQIKDNFYYAYEIERGPAHPDNLPYYLMIVGEPEVIPHRFQYLLDVQHGVGRIAFDELEEYTRYAESVVAAEKGQCNVLPEMTFFSVQNDSITERSEKGMVQPLMEALKRDREEWTVKRSVDVYKRNLGNYLGGASTPALLFMAAHGLGYRSGHPLQKLNQGAILCQDWQGDGPVKDHEFFAAADVACDARLRGLIAFMFGCYTAGTPQVDNFPRRAMLNPRLIAPKSFVSPLAKRLLSHPEGGALAVMGHVDRAWTRTFGTGNGKGCRHVESLVKYLLDGYPVGAAMDWMNERFAELSTELTDVLDKQKESLRAKYRDIVDPRWLTGLWRASNDARNFVVIGDPAVRVVTGPRRAILGQASFSSEETPTKKAHLRKVLGNIIDREQIEPEISPATLLRQRRGQES